MVLAAGLDPKGDAHLSKVIEVCQTHAGKKGDLLIVLQDIQAIYGYVPKETLGIVSQALGAAPSEIYGVRTFYNRFHLHPRGKHTVRCCRGTACHFKRSGEVIESVRQHLGLENEDTTKDFQFSLEEVACLGACGIAPVMTIDEDTIGNLTDRKSLGGHWPLSRNPSRECRSGRKEKRKRLLRPFDLNQGSSRVRKSC